MTLEVSSAVSIPHEITLLMSVTSNSTAMWFGENHLASVSCLIARTEHTRLLIIVHSD